MAVIKYLFATDKKPRRGLLAAEWVMVGYLVLTLVLILFTWTKLPDPEPMVWGRLRIVVTTAALWAVYRMVPCRFTLLCRVTLQLALLSWWYPDTFDLNRIFPNLDHIFAAAEQSVFGCQPALLFAERLPNPVVSELMYLGYSSYFLLVAAVAVYYFFRRYDEFLRTAFVILASFFLFYVVFVALPVTGPQFYYLAAGLNNVAQGVFPDVGNYFLTHDEMMTMPGYEDGFFYQIMIHAHAAGERPTAAFPSSHVGVTLVLLLLAIRTRCRGLVAFVATLFVLMCFATVYIRAHYVIDVFAGLVTGAIFYLALQFIYPFGGSKRGEKRPTCQR
jgi:membrane-associated phospholipid phosphatase